ncbi:YncE family protein [Gracilibacillus salinarum]|uniref:YncE family protein n=1 Tax=Gracilibacillus salinarum TaxID=2932255 RepID=A0ABY4GIP6_9BACI|nr:beta-propeller fold lactonase family protein [Gracilibacillus salinarum]UOQ84079.1 YncE family protein [Gracilibacillus salinarum]
MKLQYIILICISCLLFGCAKEMITVPVQGEPVLWIAHLQESDLSFVHVEDEKVTSTGLDFSVSDMEQINNETIILSSENEDFLYKLNSETGELTQWYEAGKGVNEIIYDSDKKLLFFSNRVENTVTAVDVENGNLFGKVEVGDLPVSMTINNEDRLLYVVNTESATISVIQMDDMKKEKEFATLKYPNGVFFDGEYLWIGGHGGDGILNDQVYLYDPGTGEEADRIEVGLMPIAFHANYSKSEVYVLSHGANRVYRINVEDRSVEQSIEVGANPHAITSDKQHIYVTSLDDHTLSIIDKETLQLIKQIEMNEGPYKMMLGDDNG